MHKKSKDIVVHGVIILSFSLTLCTSTVNADNSMDIRLLEGFIKCNDVGNTIVGNHFIDMEVLVGPLTGMSVLLSTHIRHFN